MELGEATAITAVHPDVDRRVLRAADDVYVRNVAAGDVLVRPPPPVDDIFAATPTPARSTIDDMLREVDEYQTKAHIPRADPFDWDARWRELGHRHDPVRLEWSAPSMQKAIAEFTTKLGLDAFKRSGSCPANTFLHTLFAAKDTTLAAARFYFFPTGKEVPWCIVDLDARSANDVDAAGLRLAAMAQFNGENMHMLSS